MVGGQAQGELGEDGGAVVKDRVIAGTPNAEEDYGKYRHWLKE